MITIEIRGHKREITPWTQLLEGKTKEEITEKAQKMKQELLDALAYGHWLYENKERLACNGLSIEGWWDVQIAFNDLLYRLDKGIGF